MTKVALVVGASSGLGRAVAQCLAAHGIKTYAGARSFAKDVLPPPGCIPVVLDVTEDASVSAAVETVLAAEGRIDALVNCAAILMLGACEEMTDDELSRVLATNVRGMARMTRAVLPAMRAQGAGQIIQFSSLNGRFAIPFQGAYTLSKHAVEGYAEALAMETRRFGIAVTLIEPGDCRQGSQAYRLQAAASQSETSPYRDAFERASAKIHHDESTGMAPEKVARAVLKTLTRKRPPARVVVARIDQRLALWLHTLLPGRWMYRILEWYYGVR